MAELRNSFPETRVLYGVIVPFVLNVAVWPQKLL